VEKRDHGAVVPGVPVGARTVVFGGVTWRLRFPAGALVVDWVKNFKSIWGETTGSEDPAPMAGTDCAEGIDSSGTEEADIITGGSTGTLLKLVTVAAVFASTGAGSTSRLVLLGTKTLKKRNGAGPTVAK
jgi:hypothetical protein